MLFFVRLNDVKMKLPNSFRYTYCASFFGRDKLLLVSMPHFWQRPDLYSLILTWHLVCFIFFQIVDFPIILVLGHWELWKDFWQNCLSHILTSFMLLDIFDSCLGFIHLINLISTVASMLTEMISNNVLLIPVLNEDKDTVAYDNISYSWGLHFEFEIVPPRSSPQFNFNWSCIASLIRSVLHVHFLTRLSLRDSEKIILCLYELLQDTALPFKTDDESHNSWNRPCGWIWKKGIAPRSWGDLALGGEAHSSTCWWW